MDQAGIAHIEKNALAGRILEGLDAKDLDVVPLPDNYKLHSLEAFLDAPSRFRGTFSTQYVDEFARYVKASIVTNTGGSDCFVDAEAMEATAFIDLGTPDAPLHADHRAKVKLTALAEYKALYAVNGKHLNQRDMAEWIEDWRNYLEASTSAREVTTRRVLKDRNDNPVGYAADAPIPENPGKIDIKAAIAAVRCLTLEAKVTNEHATDSLKASRSALESIEAKGKNNALPGFLYFTCTPYQEIASRTFELRLGVLTDKASAATPIFVLRIAQLEQHVEEMAKEFQALVKTKMADSPVNVYLGEFAKK